MGTSLVRFIYIFLCRLYSFAGGVNSNSIFVGAEDEQTAFSPKAHRAKNSQLAVGYKDDM